MTTIYDGDGNKLGNLPLSSNQREQLAAGEEITVQYHTPQRLQAKLGARSGSFLLRQDGERVVTRTPQIVGDVCAMIGGNS